MKGEKMIRSNKHFISLLLGLLMMMPLVATAHTWDFSTVSQSDKDNLNADTQGWLFDSSNNRWKNQTVYNKQPLMANGSEVQFTKGLLVTAADRPYTH
jgi:hypothetical protein